MKKQKAPYAPSTLKRLYSKLDLELAPLGLDVTVLNDYVQACANFYQIIEVEEAWKMMPRALPKSNRLKSIPRGVFDAFLSIAGRDAEKGYRILQDKELYDDGGEGLYIICGALLIAPNPDFGEKELKRYKACAAKGEAYTGVSPEIITYANFYALQEQREGKPIYVPREILKYLDEDYYEKTPQVVAMEKFLRKIGVPNADVRLAMVLMLADIRDIGIPMRDLPEAVMADIEEYGGKIKGIQQYRQYLDLLTDLSNNTSMPSNRGFTPNELHAKMSGGSPKQLSFGPGIQKSMKDGELDAGEMRRMILSSDLPDELKASMLGELSRVSRDAKNAKSVSR